MYARPLNGDVPDAHKRCTQDLWNAVEEDRFQIETPTTCVEQNALDALTVSYQPDVYRYGTNQVESITLEFGVLCNTDKRQQFSTELTDTSTVAVYGNQHVWELSEVWSEDVYYRPNGDSGWIEYEHKHEWISVDLIGWR